jgi:hypothetical protein
MNLKTLNLNIDYNFNGNSNGEQLSTLAIALNGEDFNDLYEYNYDYLNESSDYVLNNFDAEPLFLESLNQTQKEDFKKQVEAGDISKYQESLESFTEELKEQARNYNLPDSNPLAQEMQKAMDDASDQLHKDWLHGDYRGNFPGILNQAEKRYGLTFEYDRKNDIITIADAEDAIAEAIDSGYIDNESEFIEYLQDSINQDSVNQYNKRKAEQAKRRAEYQAAKEYKAKRAQEQVITEKANLIKKLS